MIHSDNILMYNCILQMHSEDPEEYPLDMLVYSNSHKKLKKEYVRTMIIIGFKRATRQIQSDSMLPIKDKLHFFKENDMRAESLLKKISSLFKSNPLLQEICSVKNNPMNDNRKNKHGCNSAFNSYNEAYCCFFFESESVRECFSYYVELIFIQFDPKILCQKFKFLCCESKCHSSGCLKK